LKNKYLIILFLLILFFNCEDKKGDSIAYVEDSHLTRKKLQKIVPESKKIGSIDENYLNSIVSDWVQNEILFKEAKKNHFDEDKTIKYKVDKYFKNLVTQEYVNYYIHSKTKISEDKLRKYYRNNKNLFKRNNETVLAKHFFNENYEIAKNTKLVLSSRNEKKINNLLKNHEYDVQYVESGNCIKKFQELIFNGQNKQVYGPIVTDFGYHVIKVDKRYNKGSIKKFSEVRDEIGKKLAQKSSHKQYLHLLDSLKNKYYWKINKNKLNRILGEL